ncbi:arylesterase [Seongchinamella sediminis]|uniref:Arylesterase n=1 Tax=Seongchinamella sediminis TaxID=2283635 RepID=A0A3L7E289_9GAMM|nr:arylesterase [Seongchinamella sediminis]RLQ23025.1 arylesterase [Seongchinamella sediminis]
MQFSLYRLLRAFTPLGLLLLVLVTSNPARANTLLVVGDSISAAYGMSLDKGWVALLAGRMAGSYPDYSVVNASISGETTDGALRRIDKLLQQYQPSVVLIELGGNDGLRGFPIKRFRDNLQQLAQRSQVAGARVIIAAMRIPPNYGSRYADSFYASFGLVAQATESILAPFILENIATEPGLMQADGIHPTLEAQPILLDNLYPYIEKALQ